MRNCFHCTDCSDCCLRTDYPFIKDEIVRLVHQFEDDEFVVGVLRCQLRPQIREFFICRSALPNNTPIPPRKVVHIEHTVGAHGQAGLHELIICGEVRLVQRSDFIVGEILPRNGCIESDIAKPREPSKTYAGGRRSCHRP